MLCRNSSAAQKRYQRRSLVAMGAYAVILFGSAAVVRHGAPHGWYLYFWALLPAIPVVAVIVQMGRYLQEETDEYLRLMTMRALLVGTAALLAAIVVGDFLRAFAHAEPFPPFVCFLIFCAAFVVAQGVQKLRNRPNDE